jgi:polyisoprenyl-phosphate glycosyltransferase
LNEARAVYQASLPKPEQPAAAISGKPGLLSVAIPVLNEERSLPRLLDRLVAVLDRLGRPWEVIFVDDGSKDGTAAMLMAINARDPRFKAVVLSRNFGKEIAVAAGLRYAAGAAAVVMDGDLQHPPEAIPALVRQWEQGYDVVYGERANRATDTTLHRLMARLFYGVFETMSHTELPQGAGDFRLVDRKVIDVLNRMDERARFNKGLFAWVGFRSVGVPYQVEARGEGRSRWRLRQLLRFALDGLVSFSTIPLRVWSYLGLLISAFAFMFALYILVEALVFGINAPGFPTLIISVMFFAGVQLISLGVIGEYLGRVYEEVKGRPLFVVAREIGLGADSAPRVTEREVAQP